MSAQEKYNLSKRKQRVGTYTAKEIIKLLRMRELSTIHKVDVDGEVMTVATFIDTYEAGGLPEQNLAKEELQTKQVKKSGKSGSSKSKSSSASSQIRSKGADRPLAKGKVGREGPLPKKNKKRMASSTSKTVSSKPQKSDKLMPKPLSVALTVGLFLILAYLGLSGINGYMIKGQIENLFEKLTEARSGEFEVIDIELEGVYLLDNPRYAKVQVLRNDKPRTYDFKITGYGMSGRVEPVKKNKPTDAENPQPPAGKEPIFSP